MKKSFYFLVIAIFALTLSACTSNPEAEKPIILDNDLLILSDSCENNSGVWVDNFSECEYVSEDWCLENNGTFNECESACRNDAEAEICILMCVPVCKF